MAIGYRFGGSLVGREHNAFRTFQDCEEFLMDQLSPGESESVDEIKGDLISDDGGRDGLIILVKSKRHYKTVKK